MAIAHIARPPPPTHTDVLNSPRHSPLKISQTTLALFDQKSRRASKAAAAGAGGGAAGAQGGAEAVDPKEAKRRLKAAEKAMKKEFGAAAAQGAAAGEKSDRICELCGARRREPALRGNAPALLREAGLPHHAPALSPVAGHGTGSFFFLMTPARPAVRPQGSSLRAAASSSITSGTSTG